jgi:hypothetical protein
MSIPATREDFKNFVLRKLGAPVIQINVSEEQVQDRIDEALYMYATYHYEGSEKTYYTYSVQEADIANRYITLPSNIIGAMQLFPIGDALNTNSLFNMRYQFVVNDLYNISNQSIIPYYMVMNHVQFLEQMLVGRQPIRYNRHNNICYLDMDWDQITVGEYLIVECYSVVDPADFPGVWSDSWLQKYTTALIKKNWGEILKLYNGIKMPGQITFNGQMIFDEAIREIQILERDLFKDFSQPLGCYWG